MWLSYCGSVALPALNAGADLDLNGSGVEPDFFHQVFQEVYDVILRTVVEALCSERSDVFEPDILFGWVCLEAFKPGLDFVSVCCRWPRVNYPGCGCNVASAANIAVSLCMIM